MKKPNSESLSTIREVLFGASRFFEERGIRSPLFNAETLLLHVLGWDKTKLLLAMNDSFPAEKRAAWDELVARRGEQVPLQHLTGVQEFYGREFSVSGDVLIPRPETEILIEQILQRQKLFGERPLIVDIGTGSGAISVTLACEWPGAQVVAVDLSPAALSMAKRNAKRHGVLDRITFVEGDLVTPVLERGLRPDIVVSNPPYIPTQDCEELDIEVREHEPRLALDGGEDGMYPYRVISRALPQLWPVEGPAMVAYEVGIHQDRAIEQMIRDAVPGVQTGIVDDYAGIGRVVWGLRSS